MRQFIWIFIAVVLASCGSNDNKNVKNENDLSENPDYQQGLALVGKSDCFSCHNVSAKLVGPAYADVAKRYASEPVNVDTLAMRIINGSKGHWDTPDTMTAHKDLSPDDARAMVKYVLTLK